MSYSIYPGEDVTDGLRRVAGEEIGCILQALKCSPPRPENIFDARRHIKKTRALLRFVEKPFTEKSFARERVILRRLAKNLAPYRDSSVKESAFRKLLEEIPKQKQAALLSDGREISGQGKGEQIDARRCSEWAGQLQGILDRSSQWEFDSAGNKQFRERVKESYRRCRKATCHQVSLKKSDLFHEWRKEVKELGYHLSLVKFAWRKEASELRKRIKTLSRSLGEHHDMDLVQEWVCAMGEKNPKKKSEYKIMIHAIKEKKMKLQKHAVKFGKKLFSKKPGEFVDDYLCFSLEDGE